MVVVVEAAFRVQFQAFLSQDRRKLRGKTGNVGGKVAQSRLEAPRLARRNYKHNYYKPTVESKLYKQRSYR